MAAVSGDASKDNVCLQIANNNAQLNTSMKKHGQDDIRSITDLLYIVFTFAIVAGGL